MRILTDNIQAIIWIIISCFWLAVMGAIIRHISEEIHASVIILIRSIFALLFLTIWLMITRRREFKLPRTHNIKLHIYRGILGTISMLLWVYALSVAPLTQVMAVDYVAPIFTTLLAVIFLKEKMTYFRTITLLGGFVGAMIIIRPGTDNFNIGLIAALGASLLYATSLLIYKKITSLEGNKTLVFYTWVMMIIMVLPLAAFYWTDLTVQQLLWLAAVGQVSNFVFFSISYAFKKADLVVIIPFEFSSLFFASIIAFFIFDELIDIWTIIGSIILIASFIYSVNKEKYACGKK